MDHGDGIGDSRADGRLFECRGGYAWGHGETGDRSRHCPTLRSGDQKLGRETATGETALALPLSSADVNFS